MPTDTHLIKMVATNITMPDSTTNGPDCSMNVSANMTPEHELIMPKVELSTAYLKRFELTFFEKFVPRVNIFVLRALAADGARPEKGSNLP